MSCEDVPTNKFVKHSLVCILLCLPSSCTADLLTIIYFIYLKLKCIILDLPDHEIFFRVPTFHNLERPNADYREFGFPEKSQFLVIMINDFSKLFHVFVQLFQSSGVCCCCLFIYFKKFMDTIPGKDM